MGDVETAEPPSKKQKNKKFKQPSTPAAGGTFPYHSEDETLLKVCIIYIDFYLGLFRFLVRVPSRGLQFFKSTPQRHSGRLWFGYSWKTYGYSRK